MTGTSQIRAGMYGGISVKNNATVTSVSSAGFTQFVLFDTNNPSNDTIPDHTENHLKITYGGDYFVMCSMVVENNGGVGLVVDADVFANNGTKTFNNLHFHRTLASSSDKGSTNMSGIVTLADNDTLEVWLQGDNEVAKNITISDCTLTAIKL